MVHTAAGAYSWENVLQYDTTFRQLMATYPLRSWAKTYTQAWHLCMTEPLGRKQVTNLKTRGNFSGNPSAQKDWRDDCCWRFNKNRCKKSATECNFDHRCTYCGGWYHGAGVCQRKGKKNVRRDDRQDGRKTTSKHGVKN